MCHGKWDELSFIKQILVGDDKGSNFEAQHCLKTPLMFSWHRTWCGNFSASFSVNFILWQWSLCIWDSDQAFLKVQLCSCSLSWSALETDFFLNSHYLPLLWFTYCQQIVSFLLCRCQMVNHQYTVSHRWKIQMKYCQRWCHHVLLVWRQNTSVLQNQQLVKKFYLNCVDNYFTNVAVTYFSPTFS